MVPWRLVIVDLLVKGCQAAPWWAVTQYPPGLLRVTACRSGPIQQPTSLALHTPEESNLVRTVLETAALPLS